MHLATSTIHCLCIAKLSYRPLISFFSKLPPQHGLGTIWQFTTDALCLSDLYFGGHESCKVERWNKPRICSPYVWRLLAAISKRQGGAVAFPGAWILHNFTTFSLYVCRFVFAWEDAEGFPTDCSLVLSTQMPGRIYKRFPSSCATSNCVVSALEFGCPVLWWVASFFAEPFQADGKALWRMALATMDKHTARD